MTPISRRRFIAISATAGMGLLIAGRNHARAGRVHWRGAALGASASLSIVGMPRADAERLIAAVQAEIERMEAIFSLYRPDSAIMRLNRDGALEAPPLDLVSVLSLAGSIHAATGGAFDPTVQPVWRLLADTQGAPTASDLAAARALMGWPDVRVSSRRIVLPRPGMAITLNGIAQGYATDRVAALLRSAGLENLLVSVGEISALGRDEKGAPWAIGIAEKEDAPPEESVALSDLAIATSAPLGTVLSPDGRTGHIIDPRPVPAGAVWRRVSVIHPSAAIADGLSTAFVLMNAPEIAEAARAFRNTRIVAVAPDDTRFDFPT